MGSRSSNEMETLAKLDTVHTPPGGQGVASRRATRTKRKHGSSKPTRIQPPGSSFMPSIVDAALNSTSSVKKMKRAKGGLSSGHRMSFHRASVHKRGISNESGRDFLGQAQERQGHPRGSTARGRRKDFANTKSMRSLKREMNLRITSEVCDVKEDDDWHFLPSEASDECNRDENKNSDSFICDQNMVCLESGSDGDAHERYLPSKPLSMSKITGMGGEEVAMITKNLRRSKPPEHNGVLNLRKVTKKKPLNQTKSTDNVDYIYFSSDENEGCQSSTPKKSVEIRRDYCLKDSQSSEKEQVKSSIRKYNHLVVPKNLHDKVREKFRSTASSFRNMVGSHRDSLSSSTSLSTSNTTRTSTMTRRRSRRLQRSNRNNKSSPIDSIIILSSDEESDEEIANSEDLVDDNDYNNTDTQDGIPKQQETQRRSARVEKKQIGDRKTISATRIAIGSKVFCDSCKLSYQPGTQNPFLRLEYRRPASIEELTVHTFYLNVDEIKEVQRYTTKINTGKEMTSDYCAIDTNEQTTSSISNDVTSNEVEPMKDPSSKTSSSFDADKKNYHLTREICTNDELQDFVDPSLARVEETSESLDASSDITTLKDDCIKAIGTTGTSDDEDARVARSEVGTHDAAMVQTNPIPTNTVNDEESKCNEMNYLIFRISPNTDNGLLAYSNAYLPDDKMPSSQDNPSKRILRKRFVIIEIRDGETFNSLISNFIEDDALGPLFICNEPLDGHSKDNYIQALLPVNSKKRTASNASHRSQFKEDETVLVYPFRAAASELDSAAAGLIEAAGKLSFQNDDRPFAGIEETNGTNSDGSQDDSGVTNKTHMVTIRGEDYDRLVPQEFLNDTLIDFWMKWIMRKMEADEKPIHVFTTQFFSRLEDEGVNAVTSWTAKKRIDIFEKKFIFIPVNKDIHWSLLVVVNPGKMINSATEELSNKEADVPFILFLDSLRAHKKKKLKVLIYKWLNSEARRLGKFNTLEARGPFKDNDAFNSLTMPIMDPRVPTQDNSWDCGVFVCRYAYGLLRLYDTRFTCNPTIWKDNSHRKKLGKKWITDSPEFNFDMSDIARLRREMAKLIVELSKIYNEKLEIKRLNTLKKKENNSKKFQHGTGPADIDI